LDVCGCDFGYTYYKGTNKNYIKNEKGEEKRVNRS